MSRILLSFSLIFLKILKLLLIIRHASEKCSNSNFDADRSNFFENKAVRLVLGLYV